MNERSPGAIRGFFYALVLLAVMDGWAEKLRCGLSQQTYKSLAQTMQNLRVAAVHRRIARGESG